MEKSQFKKNSDIVLKEYGFIKKGTAYILNLQDIVIIMRQRSWRGVKSWDYTIGIRALHNCDTPLENISDTDIEIHLEHNSSLSGYHAHEILYEEYSEEYYTELFNNMLHKEFDGYKLYGLEYLKQNFIGKALSFEAMEYLGVLEYFMFVVNFHEEINMFYRGSNNKMAQFSKNDNQIKYNLYINYHNIEIFFDENKCMYQIDIERETETGKNNICLTKSSKYKREVLEYLDSKKLNQKSLQDHIKYLANVLNVYYDKNICNEYKEDLDFNGILI